jgi:hypothetical protein
MLGVHSAHGVAGLAAERAAHLPAMAGFPEDGA